MTPGIDTSEANQDTGPRRAIDIRADWRSGDAWAGKPAGPDGFFKLPVTEPIWLCITNLNGDGQADLKNHGGPEKAMNVYPLEHYPYWQQVLKAAEFPFGSFGENLTTEGCLRLRSA